MVSKISFILSRIANGVLALLYAVLRVQPGTSVELIYRFRGSPFWISPLKGCVLTLGEVVDPNFNFHCFLAERLWVFFWSFNKPDIDNDSNLRLKAVASRNSLCVLFFPNISFPLEYHGFCSLLSVFMLFFTWCLEFMVVSARVLVLCALLGLATWISFLNYEPINT